MTSPDDLDPFEQLTGHKSIIPRSNLKIPPPAWLSALDDRSVRAGGDITGSTIVTGDHNTVTTHVTLPQASSVDPKAELAALRQALAGLQVPERRKLEHGLVAAEDEVATPKPDREYVADMLKGVLKAAKGANGFAEQIETLSPRIAALASWAGPAGHALLSLVGLSS
jgi:hypothetical protein